MEEIIQLSNAYITKDGVLKASIDKKNIEQLILQHIKPYQISLTPIFDEIESLDICTGDWEVVIKLRNKDIDEYYNFVKTAIKHKGIIKIKSLTSLKQIKTEFVLM